METFIFGFSRPKNTTTAIFANGIMFLYKTKYSHVYVRFYSHTFERWLIYESVGKGTRFVSFERWQKEAKVIKEYNVPISKFQKVEIIKSCIDNLGKKYGVMQAVGIGFQKILKDIFNIKINNPFRDKKKDICSEAVYDILKILGHKMNIHKEEVSPKDIEHFLEKLSQSSSSVDGSSHS